MMDGIIYRSMANDSLDRVSPLAHLVTGRAVRLLHGGKDLSCQSG